jgi:hypothetical protein
MGLQHPSGFKATGFGLDNCIGKDNALSTEGNAEAANSQYSFTRNDRAKSESPPNNALVHLLLVRAERMD